MERRDIERLFNRWTRSWFARDPPRMLPTLDCRIGILPLYRCLFISIEEIFCIYLTPLEFDLEMKLLPRSDVEIWLIGAHCFVLFRKISRKISIKHVSVLGALDAGSLRWISRHLKNFRLVIFSDLSFLSKFSKECFLKYVRWLQSKVQNYIISPL